MIVFTQYTDTMDYLRGKLKQVYGGQVACYSGRGGERWDGVSWRTTSKENIKTAFRETDEIKILLCTESASEGLNLQTCGVLINYEMPWNPMRVEQRIGRIDRIGQEFDRVWIRNYFYDGTVEATVYQRLDERIASFESVVGELQPILSQVARVIEAAAMANDKRRGELIAKEIAEINRQVQSAEVSSLNLSEFTADDVAAVEVRPVPLTLQDLERTIAKSNALGNRLEPHPSLTGAHLLDWHGQMREVTFNSKLFDEHPNTLVLLSFGSDLLAAILQVVDPPHCGQDTGIVARCIENGHRATVGYLGAVDEKPITSLNELLQRLDKPDAVTVPTERRFVLQQRFADAIRELLLREGKAAQDQRKALVSSLTEEIRQLLVEAAYIELAEAANRDLFDEPLPLDFSEGAYQRLRRHKVPFAGAIKLVGRGLPIPSRDDALYLRLRESRKDVLSRRFDAIRGTLADRLRELMDARRVLDNWVAPGEASIKTEVQLLSGQSETVV